MLFECYISFYLYVVHRTIIDVNIDAFEWKPWRHPGADITDFFNFGLDEDSWKCYCSCLVNEILSMNCIYLRAVQYINVLPLGLYTDLTLL